ncbi:hypothetical protein CS0771_65450 [Catellatospora sp. IY07-71]|uniref:endonuclease NucS domain-containing protein n=1 Tax=Catellatospora sp. IY07-71 TaxID=2728827 RepID=UPI001BB35B59|nr:endonuclease NucS domain-containing protein [Catellatospora sp. IY07-71]BCJ77001.1 hypothetical protein CS0771_65450 [Catellatospora sp. IY07-71]
MPLFEMTSDALLPVPSTTFAAELILERADLQRLLRSRIDMIADGVMVVSEEFGAFADARRRIDLLGVDRDGRLVVVELKRTADGGHLELQALRYAAMISVMTFDDLVEHYQRHLAKVEPDAVEDARCRLADFLDDVGGEEAVLSREVRVVLVAAGFDREITTTVLWLNDVYGLDIRCVRLTPYKIDQRILLDVQQVIPLPEASELTIQLRRRQTQVRVSGADNRDWTPYEIITPGGRTGPLRKRRAMLAMVTFLHQAGVSAAELATVIPRSRFLPVDGVLTDEQLGAAFVATYAGAQERLGRWFIEAPLHDDGRTWVLSKMWGTNTKAVLDRLLTIAPGEGFGYEAVEEG